jgi:hypothetical protein
VYSSPKLHKVRRNGGCSHVMDVMETACCYGGRFPTPDTNLRKNSMQFGLSTIQYANLQSFWRTCTSMIGEVVGSSLFGNSYERGTKYYKWSPVTRFVALISQHIYHCWLQGFGHSHVLLYHLLEQPWLTISIEACQKITSIPQDKTFFDILRFL